MIYFTHSDNKFMTAQSSAINIEAFYSQYKTSLMLIVKFKTLCN